MYIMHTSRMVPKRAAKGPSTSAIVRVQELHGSNQLLRAKWSCNNVIAWPRDCLIMNKTSACMLQVDYEVAWVVVKWIGGMYFSTNFYGGYNKQSRTTVSYGGNRNSGNFV